MLNRCGIARLAAFVVPLLCVLSCSQESPQIAKLYWTDEDTGNIQRANLDGSQRENLITRGLQWPFGLALWTH